MLGTKLYYYSLYTLKYNCNAETTQQLMKHILYISIYDHFQSDCTHAGEKGGKSKKGQNQFELSKGHCSLKMVTVQ